MTKRDSIKDESNNIVMDFDDNGYVKYEKLEDGGEIFHINDDEGNCIYRKNELGHEYYYEYYKGRKIELSRKEFIENNPGLNYDRS